MGGRGSRWQMKQSVQTGFLFDDAPAKEKVNANSLVDDKHRTQESVERAIRHHSVNDELPREYSTNLRSRTVISNDNPKSPNAHANMQTDHTYFTGSSKQKTFSIDQINALGETNAKTVAFLDKGGGKTVFTKTKNYNDAKFRSALNDMKIVARTENSAVKLALNRVSLLKDGGVMTHIYNAAGNLVGGNSPEFRKIQAAKAKARRLAKKKG